MSTADTFRDEPSPSRPPQQARAPGPEGSMESSNDPLGIRVPPHSAEAEVCVLGGMVLDPATIDIVVGIVHADDFFFPANEVLFNTLVAMHNAPKPVDLVSLSEELKRAQQFDRIGGVDALVRLVDSVPSTANCEYYANLVRDKSLLRKLIAANREVIEEAYASHDEPAEILDRAEHVVFEIASRQIGEGAVPLESLMQQTFETLSNADGSIVTGLATGYHKLDELTSGLQNDEMIVLAARPSMGKTALACNIAEFIAADDGNPVVLFSLEMSKAQLAQRFLCSRARFNSQKLRRGNISPEDWTHLQMAAGDLIKAPIYIDDSVDLNVLRLRAKARRLAASVDIRCIIVDYLQLMAPMGSGMRDSRQQQISEMSRGIKALARELHVPVLVLSQLNRGPEGREGHRPRMSDLRESGAIEQDADVVMLMHREDYYHRDDPDYVPTGVTELIIAKQRNGPVDTIPLTFLRECVRFENFASGGMGEY